MFFKYTMPAILWAFFIGALCAIPGQDLPKSDWFELLSLDKLVHASMFAILALLLIRSFKNQNQNTIFYKYAALIVLLICIPYGGILELMQGAYFENRTADIYDFIANSVGTLIGVWYSNKIIAR